MTDTKEFNKSLDRIAKALSGEEWTPEDKPEAIYKLLDKIADKLEENGTGSSSGGTLYVNVVVGFYDESEGGAPLISCDKTYSEIIDWIDNNGSVVVKGYELNGQEEPIMDEYKVYYLSHVYIYDSYITFVNHQRNGYSNFIEIYGDGSNGMCYYEQYNIRS